MRNIKRNEKQRYIEERKDSVYKSNQIHLLDDEIMDIY